MSKLLMLDDCPRDAASIAQLPRATRYRFALLLNLPDSAFTKCTIEEQSRLIAEALEKRDTA